MPAIITAIKFLLVGLTLTAITYYAMCIFAAARFFSAQPARQEFNPLPVTILIPLEGADFKAYENYARFCRQDYPEYQIVFGVRDYRDCSIPIVQKLIADFTDRDIELVICPDTIGQNYKVGNLQNMLRRAKHERIVIVDSDIRVGRDYLRRVIPPLSNGRVGLVTCLYRAAEAPTYAARIEAVGLTAEFAPGVLSAWLLEEVRFALGSTMATTKTKLGEAGGFQSIADYLADDFMLGNLISRAGYEVHLSDYAVETVLAPVGFLDMMKHQLRWARSTRKSRPIGYMGLILTYGTAFSLLNIIADHASTLSILLFASTLVVRLTMAWLIGVHWLGDKILKKHFWLVPVKDILSFLIWFLSLGGREVEWRGRHFEIVDDGKIVEVS
jgi:ceramide glucosyltransferase